MPERKRFFPVEVFPKLAHRTWQCSHKNLGKVEREMVRETHKTVRGCCKSDLIFNLQFDKYQERENFNVFRQMSWKGGWDLLENDKETQWQKPAWVLCLFGGNCALTPQTNGARSSFPSTQPQSTVQYVTWWWWSPIKASSFCNLSTPGVPCPFATMSKPNRFLQRHLPFVSNSLGFHLIHNSLPNFYFNSN